ncbi:DUF6011 domain-containing protein [Streptomyces sp. NPDC060366]|uniref:DUF6011 domain-containing protein n=1 Tax=Streptomyces sp. NPDC060366 TaxID=3347105 RepID=UPI003665D89E
MSRSRAHQEPLADVTAPRPPTIRCRTCKRPLTDAISRSRRLGPECDPDRQGAHQRHDIDQDPLPGT